MPPFDSFLGAYIKRDMNRSSEQVENIDELKDWDIAAVKSTSGDACTD
jgi:hypothetical protein